MKGETACGQWLSGLMKQHPTGDPGHRSKAKFRELADKEFKTGSRQFDRAWRRAIEDNPKAQKAWTKAGAKPSARNRVG
jgi:hypothetical protein